MERALESVFWARLNSWAALRIDSARGLNLCLRHLEILNISSLNLYCVRQVQFGNEACVNRADTPGGSKQAPASKHGGAVGSMGAEQLAWPPGVHPHGRAVWDTVGLPGGSQARICAQTGSSRRWAAVHQGRGERRDPAWKSLWCGSYTNISATPQVWGGAASTQAVNCEQLIYKPEHTRGRCRKASWRVRILQRLASLILKTAATLQSK